jgi:phosphate starvation-inducible PhoH-like protein
MTRPLISVDEELGFLPGTMENKMEPWVRPIFDILSGFYTGAEIKKMMEDDVLEISPLAYMRGRTFKRVYLIADEMQNSTPNQMLMLLTRIGKGSRLVITGDLLQSDLVGMKNGLQDFYGRFKGRRLEGVHLVEFDKGDVKRSSLVSTILSLYDNKNQGGSQDAALIPIDIYKPV